MTAVEAIISQIELIRKNKKKEIKLAYEKSKKIRESVSKNLDKMSEGLDRIINETDPLLTEEGVQKITKKGKMYFNSLKTINGLSHFVTSQFTDLNLPDGDQDGNLISEELSQYIRRLSRKLNDISVEQVKADKIMGLDFMLKKRSFYNPLKNINEELGNLRELQKAEYRVIKALEDLESISSDISTNLQSTSEKNDELTQLIEEFEHLSEETAALEAELAQALDNPLIQESRQHSIRMTELEINLGRRLNSFKKTFKKFARETQRGSVSSDFGIVSSALGYEENPVQRFLAENEQNSEIITLLTELENVGPELKLKQNEINKVKQLKKRIEDGRLNREKQEWHQLNGLMQKETESPELKQALENVETIETKLNEKKEQLANKEDQINLKKKELSALASSLEERQERANTIMQELEEPLN